MRWVPGEAARNVLSGTTHALRYAVALGVALAALATAEVVGTDAILSRAAAYRDSGGSVLTLEAVGQVDGSACDALGDAPGVRAAGALRAEPEPLIASALPRGPIAAYAVTGGLLEVLGAERTAEPGVVLSRMASEGLGVGAGEPLAMTTGSTAVHGVYDWPDDGRRSGLGYAALVPTRANDTYDQCWVDAWPAPPNLPTLVRTVLLRSADGTAPVVVSRLNASLGATFDGHELYAARVTRFAVAAGVATGLVVGLVSVRTRRLELASARHVGTGAAAQHVQILLECTTWGLAAVALASGPVAVAVAAGTGGDRASLLAGALHVALPGAVSALLGAQCGVLTTREDQLFRYFKNR